ncbi:hypothetical protein M2451_003832 [Dysgonomonas sp. PFB1-18]|uniref:hypothetical protein n=1 Tax=unclassified Dysgonomonas TaxID=2630389 RepID=UPI002476C233|nr:MULTISPECIES: hypothetical protein [unclassified Dysgonomonas]MDH6309486.1 hypothetical protein [Dysgonomonas sp. PF1-14]MDH6382491.1 hypothetical protein [Dysgonomonas sp. PFB1-18]MDH6399865.1 hypothetical protein [Dysgonomonas sp. PF1-23]
MKQKIIILLLLIGSTSCSSQTKDYPKDILGCWKMIDIRYEVKSNYPYIDALADSLNAIDSKESLETGGWIKFLEGNILQSFNNNGRQRGLDNYYKIDRDSLFAQNSIRDDDKKTSKMVIKDDTLYLEANVPRVFTNVLDYLKWDMRQEIPYDVNIKESMRYTIFARIPDCD